LKRLDSFWDAILEKLCERSIHPQGWVPIETLSNFLSKITWVSMVAFTPKGGCPLKLSSRAIRSASRRSS